MRAWLASNSNTPEEVLRELAKDVDRIMRKKVAENTNTPAVVLRRLAKDENSTAGYYLWISGDRVTAISDPTKKPSISQRA